MIHPMLIIKKTYGGPWWRRALVWLATCVLMIVLLFVAVDVNLLWLFGKSPGFDDIKKPQVNEASLVYSADSVLIGRYYDENRTPAKYADLSDTLINTLIDTEDERYYKHHGVDIVGIFAAAKDIVGGHPRGASTISQQLAKNLFRTRTNYSTGVLGRIPGVKLAIIKIKEMIVAMKLEMTFTKEEILTMYLNTVDFGSHSFGINTAARTYFHCTPADLTVEQCATLVALLKATNTYNPRRHPEQALERRNLVLGNLYAHNHLIVNGKLATRKQFDSICATNLLPATEEVAEEKGDESTTAPYFRQALVEYISTLCRMGLVEGYDEDNVIDINTAGLHIYTTLDTRIQTYAEEAVQEQMEIIQQRFNEHWAGTNPWRDERYQEVPNFIEDIAKRSPHYKALCRKYKDERIIDSLMNVKHPVTVFSYKNGHDTLMLSTMDSIRYMVKFMHTSMVAIEPDTRHVKAWVGDIDWDSWQYDKVLAMRQPGSTFKLFVYTEAMNQGLTPVTMRCDEWHSYPDTVDNKPVAWCPHNANGYVSNLIVPLKSAFAQSINTVAVSVGYEVGAHNVAKTAYAMGIESKLREVPSISLGSSDVNLLELTNAYATAMNDGIVSMPILVTEIVDRDGNVIFKAPSDKENKTRKQAIPYKSAFYMQQMLHGCMNEMGGTTTALWRYIPRVASYADFGGKTGTSNNHCDAWFVGTTPKLVAGVWVGGEYRCIHFRTGELGQGSRTALPIFGLFANKVFSDERFAKYRVHYPTEPKEEIPVNTYRGISVYAGLPLDSLQGDSLQTTEMLQVGEGGQQTIGGEQKDGGVQNNVGGQTGEEETRESIRTESNP